MQRPKQIISRPDRVPATSPTTEEASIGGFRLKHLQISEQTCHRWRKRYGELSPDDAKRLRELEGENARLKKLVADQALDIDMLKKISRGNF